MIRTIFKLNSIPAVLTAVFIFCILRPGCDQPQSQSQKIQTPLKRFGSLIRLKRQFEEQYIILHRYTFPGVLDRIQKCNIRNYSIFLSSGILFSHFEYVGNHFETDMAQMADSVTKDWWKLTDMMQEPLETRKKGEWWASMKQLYQMDSLRITTPNIRRFAFRAVLLSDRKQNLIDRLHRIDKTETGLFLNLHFQNVTVYEHDKQLYIYFEYSGSELEKDWTQLENAVTFRNLYTDIVTCLQTRQTTGKNQYWEQMRQVFHTD